MHATGSEQAGPGCSTPLEVLDSAFMGFGGFPAGKSAEVAAATGL